MTSEQLSYEALAEISGERFYEYSSIFVALCSSATYPKMCSATIAILGEAAKTLLSPQTLCAWTGNRHHGPDIQQTSGSDMQEDFPALSLGALMNRRFALTSHSKCKLGNSALEKRPL